LVRERKKDVGDYVMYVINEGEVVNYKIRRNGEDEFLYIDENKIINGLEKLIE
jgi:hypothetical protein